MANPSVTYTFSNGTTADATQINQNLTDIINGVTDGTKDLSISALTCAGTATLNGNVNLGNASGDDLSITASLASSIPIKTTNTYDIGSSTLGLRAAYFGANSQTVKLVGSASMSATWTFTLPVTAGTDGYVLVTNGSGTSRWDNQTSPIDATNYSIAASVSANAMTVSLKDAAGSDATATTPIYINFRSATAATGTATRRSVTGALSTTISSGSTIGHVSAVNQYVHVYAIDNAGTVELAVAGQKIWDDTSIQSTTAEGGAGAADSAVVLYSTTTRSNIAIRYLGRIKSNQATAGTWATAPSEISLSPAERRVLRSCIIDHTGAGHGSSSTKIRRIETNALTVGSDISVAYSATLGNVYTINTNGLYDITYTDRYDSGQYFNGVSVNSAALTTSIASHTPFDGTSGKVAQTGNSSTNPATSHACVPLKAGDIVRPHTDGSPAVTTDLIMFTITKVSD